MRCLAFCFDGGNLYSGPYFVHQALWGKTGLRNLMIVWKEIKTVTGSGCIQILVVDLTIIFLVVCALESIT